jgi:DNA replication protein DnaC
MDAGDWLTGKGRVLEPPSVGFLTTDRLNVARIPIKSRKATWDYYKDELPFKKQLLEYVDHLDDHRQDGQGLLLCGKSGYGKTSAACLIAMEVIKRNGYPMYVDVRRLAPLELGKYGPERKRKLRTTCFLVIDDLGAEATKEVGASMLEAILRSREQRELPTIITTNYDGDEVENRYGEGCKRVITDMCEHVPFTEE